MTQLVIPPSTLFPTALQEEDGFSAGQWLRGIPTPNSGNVQGLRANCNNLLADSPPTLLETYVIQAYSISFSVEVDGEFTAGSAPTLGAELALLVNGDIVNLNALSAVANLGDENTAALYNGTWTADLTNPISVGARDRLGIQVGYNASVAWIPVQAVIGAQVNFDDTQALTTSSTITYTTVKAAATRRL